MTLRRNLPDVECHGERFDFPEFTGVEQVFDYVDLAPFDVELDVHFVPLAHLLPEPVARTHKPAQRTVVSVDVALVRENGPAFRTGAVEAHFARLFPHPRVLMDDSGVTKLCDEPMVELGNGFERVDPVEFVRADETVESVRWDREGIDRLTDVTPYINEDLQADVGVRSARLKYVRASRWHRPPGRPSMRGACTLAP